MNQYVAIKKDDLLPWKDIVGWYIQGIWYTTFVFQDMHEQGIFIINPGNTELDVIFPLNFESFWFSLKCILYQKHNCKSNEV